MGNKISLPRRLEILADAAKYDASCASSGTDKRASVAKGRIGSTEGSGICHAYVPDGRCISLLKVQLTNYCQYDCLYCINRISSNVPRARFTVEEVAQLTLDLYRLRLDDLERLSNGIEKAMPFITAEDWQPGGSTDLANLRARLDPLPSSFPCLVDDACLSSRWRG
ncbi:MAG: hypothetical protein OXR62_00805 [Ahrensia sp.]|nr:hypothetical protein [Ahrensia sp.]